MRAILPACPDVIPVSVAASISHVPHSKERLNKESVVAQVFNEELLPFVESPSLSLLYFSQFVRSCQLVQRVGHI
jgi:hypothetical protein